MGFFKDVDLEIYYTLNPGNFYSLVILKYIYLKRAETRFVSYMVWFFFCRDWI
jgi:hypothetical protein